MKFTPIDPPRAFAVGIKDVKLKDCARLELAPDEQVTFKAGATEFDVARKSWGYYATPSLNARLPRYGFRPLLVRSHDDKFFILLMEKGKEADLKAYLEDEEVAMVCWLDDRETLKRLEDAAGRSHAL